MEITRDEEQRAQLASFLRVRRAHLSPTQAGLLPGKRRRTPGLRREEVAELANMSVAYYTWLEQARDLHVSREVIESIADALQLNTEERAYLFRLAGQLDASASETHAEQSNPLLQRMLDSQEQNPAYIIGRYGDVLAWNQAACDVLCDFAALPASELNIIWLIFTKLELRQRFVNWEKFAQDALAVLRTIVGNFTNEARFVQLRERLWESSLEFRQWWPQHEVRATSGTRETLEHPQVGRLVLDHITVAIISPPDLRMCLYLPAPTTDTAEKLLFLYKLSKVCHQEGIYSL